MNVAEKPIHHMTYDPKIHHRRSIRLRGYDYSRPKAYFVTICAQNRGCLFGKIADGEMRSNDACKIVIMAGFKSAAAKRIDQSRKTPGARVWQRNFREHVVRDEPELHRLREYIQNNPLRWEMDRLYSPDGSHG
uniref:Transposase IS200-like domain-containing protein n=1 Tax=Candidatus Kentrum sp. LFY TaxID=2126342 RepID=A0A450X3I3_9GAMM|nr:MAG: hypothetical protein BECKLFY1418C_GA0070996_11563 [Candidatus Kentron sp. LFY]